MFCAGDDDDSPKTPIVHPNDVLDIEVSPVARYFLPLPSISCEWRSQGFELSTDKTVPTTTKQKTKKQAKSNSLSHHTNKPKAASMKRGDPFLPSVFSDENPIADFTIKKNSRKKPSDCKCKGFGYNLSPSAMLPEEMRQQWGVGVFGKHVAVRPSSSASIGGLQSSRSGSTPCSIEAETSRCPISMLQPESHYSGFSNGNITTKNIAINSNTNINNNNKDHGHFSSFRCMRCMQDVCLCADLGPVRDGFRIPDYNEKKKQKIASKGAGTKGKDIKAGPCGLIGSAFSSTALKRSACFSTKEHSNIISTSNFPRNNPSPVHMPYPSFMYSSDPTGMTPGPSLMKPVSMGKIYPATEPLIIGKNNAFVNDEHLHLSRPSLGPPMSRRVVSNISPAPIISSGSLDAAVQHNFQTPKKPLLPRGVTPTPNTRRIFSQECTCDSCRSQSNLMSTMEALGLSNSDPSHTMPPFLLPRPQRFPYSRTQAYPITSRYSPYQVPSFNFKSTLRDVYGSPETYDRPCSPFYDYSESPELASTPLPMGQDVSGLDTSSLYLDATSSSVSPSSMPGGSWVVDDITDLSIQETVDFFVNMKPPIKSVPSPQSDTSSDTFSPSPGEHRCLSPCPTTGLGSCYCGGSSDTSNWGNHQVLENNYGRDRLMTVSDPPRAKFPTVETNQGPYQSSSVLYSSLVSDLEDELRCAIENIPSA
ncbi:hypothetical protein ElyMa_000832800 [Elysia marginata]|uniref:Uncharacterized protein n=1 Tax=Elysia marginata TaxID=1093978 RepID=A0AAV4H2F3_9GAST|nr:hypothetical protein ElyMa_000832800 [Elysia marginata]